MIKVINKLMEKGKHIGYVLETEGVDEVEYVLKKAMYADLYIGSLIESGYKIFSYNADDIEDAHGNKIVDLPEVEFSQDENERSYMEEVAEIALSDADASKYYTYKTNSGIKFLEAENPLINTREELLEYLNMIKLFVAQHGYSPDNKPLNAIVKREALFSCDELRKDPKMLEYFNIIAQRRIFRDIKAYESLVEWLSAQGVYDVRNKSYLTLIDAYFAWGIDGIKDECVDKQIRQNVDSLWVVFNDQDITYTGANRNTRMGIIDSTLNIRYLDKSTDASGLVSFMREPVILKKESSLMQLRRGISSWGGTAKIVDVAVADTYDKIVYKFISENGYPYYMKATHDRMLLAANGQNLAWSKMFAIASKFKGIFFNIENVYDRRTYYIWNMALAKANSILRETSVPIPVNSTFDMLIKEGMSPVAAIKWMAYQIKANPNNYKSNCIKDEFDNVPDYELAFERYTQEVPQEVLDDFHISRESYSTPEEFLLMVDSQEDVYNDLVSTWSKKFGKGDAFARQEKNAMAAQTNPISYVRDIRFVQDCIDGNVTIGAMGDGMEADATGSIEDIARLLITCAIYELGENAGTQQMIDYISNFYERTTVAKDVIYTMRDAGYKGYLKDLCQIRGERASGNSAWMWVTKSFREVSNAPIEEQRDYMMEVMSVSDKEIRYDLLCTVRDSIPQDDKFVKECMELAAPYIAANMFFFIAGGALKDKLVDDHYEFEYKLADHKCIISIPTNVYNAAHDYISMRDQYTSYITLYEYCNSEYNDNGFFEMFAVNADITPWYVHAKKGFNVKSYNFAINYNQDEAFKNFSDEWRNTLAESKGKVCYALSRLTGDQFYFNQSLTYQLEADVPYTAEDINSVLSVSVIETIRSYWKRWLFMSKQAPEDSVIYTMPLKTDVVFNAVAKIYGMEVNQEVVYVPAGQVRKNEFLHTINPKMCSYMDDSIKMLDVAVSVTQFDIYKAPFETVYTMSGILSGDFRPAHTVSFKGNQLCIFNDDGYVTEEIPLTDLPTRARELSQRGECCQIDFNHFLFVAKNGDYIVEV